MLKLFFSTVLILLLVGCGGSESSNTSGESFTNVDSLVPDHSEIDDVSTDTGEENSPPLDPVEPELNQRLPLVETKPSNWYIGVMVEEKSRGLKSQITQLGAINKPDALQKHSLMTFSPFDGYLDVMIVDPIGVDRGEYRSNYHVFQDEREELWPFTVKTDNPTADIILSWRGLYVLNPYEESGRTLYHAYRSTTNPLLKQMKLIDKKTGVEVQAIRDGRLESYLFNMDGALSREFAWVVTTQEVSLPLSVKQTLSLRAQKHQNTVPGTKTFKKKQEQKFDLFTPPAMPRERR